MVELLVVDFIGLSVVVVKLVGFVFLQFLVLIVVSGMDLVVVVINEIMLSIELLVSDGLFGVKVVLI